MTPRTSDGPPWASLPAKIPSLLHEFPLLISGFALFYGVLSLTRYWTGQVNTQAEIHLVPSALPQYAFFSLTRIGLAYLLSLIVAVSYGYAAARYRTAERFLIPLLDTLQSIPVLSFLPPVMVGMVALFPTRQLGVELGSIVLIFTGQVWNMAFSVYASMRNIPREMLEAAQVYRMSRLQRFFQLELPYSAIGLVWNSMMSVAGGWFFLMACEMFVLGSRDFRLPGLGSYLQTAANSGNTAAILWGVFTMIAVIVLIDQVIWRPLIAWAEKFKFEQVEASQVPRSPILEWVRQSRVLSRVGDALEPAREGLLRGSVRERVLAPRRGSAKRLRAAQAVGLVALAGVGYAVVKMGIMLAALNAADLRAILLGAGATFLRVEATLVLAGLWTIPVGIFIGLRPKLAALAQPVAQIAASVPATALFPIVLLILIRAGGGLGIGSMVLLLLGTQWYVLFNVIAGASAIPSDLKEVTAIYRLGTVERWKKLLLPATFPYLITGFVTASGGAWNASIVAEYFRFHGQTFTITGLGAAISRATDSGNFPMLLAGTLVMASLVVTMNRLVWRRLYGLAATRYKLES